MVTRATFRRLRVGGKISKREHDRLQHTVEELDRMAVPVVPGLDVQRLGGGFQLNVQAVRPIWAKITGSPTGSAYPFQQQLESATPGTFAINPDGAVSDGATVMLREINGSTSIAANTFWQAWPSADRSFYWFSATTSAPTTFPNPTTFNNQVTFNTGPVIINAPISWTPISVTINTPQNNYTLPASPKFYVNATGAFTVTGFTAGIAGELHLLVNTGTATCTLANENVASLAANRLHTQNGQDYQLLAGQACFVEYDATLTRWRVELTPYNQVITNDGATYPQEQINDYDTNFTVLDDPANLRTKIKIFDSPAIITLSADVADWSVPSTFAAHKFYINVSLAGAGATVKGLLADTADTVFIFVNTSLTGKTLTLTHEDASSAAANRFHIAGGAALTLQPDQGAWLEYDGNISRWRVEWWTPPAAAAAPPFSGCRSYNNANITIANNTLTGISFNSNSWDTDSYHNLGGSLFQFAAPKTGYYHVGCQVYWHTNATGYRYLDIELPSGNTIASVTQPPVAGGVVQTMQEVVTVVFLSAGSIVGFYCLQTSGANLNLEWQTETSHEPSITAWMYYLGS